VHPSRLHVLLPRWLQSGLARPPPRSRLAHPLRLPPRSRL